MDHLLSGLIYELMFQMRQQLLKAAYNSNFTVRHITLQQQNEQNRTPSATFFWSTLYGLIIYQVTFSRIQTIRQSK